MKIGNTPGNTRASDWRGRVDVSALGQGARRAILSALKDRMGALELARAIGVSRVALWRYLKGERDPPGDVIRRALGLMEEEEFHRALRGSELLRALGAVREDGSIDYSVAVEAIGAAMNDEYLRNLVLRLVAERYRDDLKRMLGLSAPRVVLRWTPEFEEYLREEKPRRRVRGDGTIRYYHSLFSRYLEGKELGPELIEEVRASPVAWVRNVFRHYVGFLYDRGDVPDDVYARVMRRVPSRHYSMDVRPYQIDMGRAARTFAFLGERHPTYYLVYRLMLEGGLRVEHAVRILAGFAPEGEVEVPGVPEPVAKLVVRDGFARYYCGFRETTKPCEWAYMSAETLEALRSRAPLRVRREEVSHYAAAHDLLAPKYVRKLAWRMMASSMSREVARFVQSRLGELKVSEARYEDLLSEGDEAYPRYLEALRASGLTARMTWAARAARPRPR
ncbi:MAG: integrase [Conexivisphaera sp.]